jgi:chloramphenicol O-acetyltransferase type A
MLESRLSGKGKKMKKIDLEKWKRKEHFEYFCSLDDPYWSIVTEVDCTKTFKYTKEHQQSFFLSYLHRILIALNKVEELKMRIVDNEIYCYEQVHASATILREDETFGCCFIDFIEDFDKFQTNARLKIAEIKERTGMCLEEDYRPDQVHFSSIPWHSFSGLTYARSLKPQDSVPKITTGKASGLNEKVTFPIAVQVHHGLVDGLHVSRFLQYLNDIL